VRKVLFLGYSYRWLRTKDDMNIRPACSLLAPLSADNCSAKAATAYGFFSPKDEDVPLKLWVGEHLDEVMA
jgi:hypothetical protein